MENHDRPVLPFEFHGEAGEYFRIWIVNLCLSLLTFGLYSPWAKIRQKRYFYGSTRLAGAAFDYVADPWAILKGRLIAAGVVLVFVAASEFLPSAEVVFWLAFVFLMPWLVIRSRRFNALNTVHRNVRFDFSGRYGSAWLNFVGLPFIIAPLSLGLAYPWIVREQKKFLLDHSAYGRSAFRLEVDTGKFWAVYLRLGLGITVGAIAIVVAPRIIEYATYPGLPDLIFAAAVAVGVEDKPTPGQVTAMLVAFQIYALFLAGYVYLDATISNLVWNNTILEGIRLRCRLRFGRLLFLYVSNVLAIALSLGLLIPWAKIRVTRYRLECFGLCCTAKDLHGFAAGQAGAASAFGEELGEMLDVDLGL